MSDVSAGQARSGHRLLQWGMVLFLFGLLTGFVIPVLANLFNPAPAWNRQLLSDNVELARRKL